MDMFLVLVWIHCPIGVGTGVTGGVGGAELDETDGDTAALAGDEAVLDSPVLLILLLFTRLRFLAATGG